MLGVHETGNVASRQHYERRGRAYQKSCKTSYIAHAARVGRLCLCEYSVMLRDIDEAALRVAVSPSSGRSFKVATLHRITIIILHYLVEASLNESDIIVALANYSASFNGNHARASCPGAAPKHRVGAFSSIAARRLRSRSLPVRSASHHHRSLFKVGVLATSPKD